MSWCYLTLAELAVLVDEMNLIAGYIDERPIDDLNSIGVAPLGRMSSTVGGVASMHFSPGMRDRVAH